MTIILMIYFFQGMASRVVGLLARSKNLTTNNASILIAKSQLNELSCTIKTASCCHQKTVIKSNAKQGDHQVGAPLAEVGNFFSFNNHFERFNFY